MGNPSLPSPQSLPHADVRLVDILLVSTSCGLSGQAGGPGNLPYYSPTQCIIIKSSLSSFQFYLVMKVFGKSILLINSLLKMVISR